MKRLTVLLFAMVLVFASVFTAEAKQKEKKNKKETQQQSVQTEYSWAGDSVQSLRNVGESVTFDIQAGEWKKGTNFVGIYTVTKVGADQYVVDYTPAETDSFKVKLESPRLWINGTGSFKTSPGNQKGLATLVQPGEVFTFTGDRMFIFFHFNATYWKAGKNNSWAKAGEDSATGYDPNGRITKSNWFMYNVIDLFESETEPPTEPEIPTEPETEPPTEPEIPTEPETEPPTEPEIPTEPETEPETEPDTEPSYGTVTYSVRYISILENKELGSKEGIEAEEGETVVEYAEQFDGYMAIEPSYVEKTVIDGEVIYFYYIFNSIG